MGFQKKDVCVVIVSYNSDEVILESIKRLQKLELEVVVIDNASEEGTRQMLQTKTQGVKFIWNKINVGIGKALNQGLSYAKKQGHSLLLTMDQDSIFKEGAVEELIEVMNMDSSIVSVGAAYTSQQLSSEQRYKEVQYLISSGNLVNVSFAVKAGGYAEELFIDSVDFDFSLKLLADGGKLVLALQAILEHKIGEFEETVLLGKAVRWLGHSPVRYYYMYRNHGYILKKYFMRFPGFCLKKTLFMGKDFLKLIFIEQQKKIKLKMVFRGIKDAFGGKYGSYED